MYGGMSSGPSMYTSPMAPLNPMNPMNHFDSNKETITKEATTKEVVVEKPTVTVVTDKQFDHFILLGLVIVAGILVSKLIRKT